MLKTAVQSCRPVCLQHLIHLSTESTTGCLLLLVAYIRVDLYVCTCELLLSFVSVPPMVSHVHYTLRPMCTHDIAILPTAQAHSNFTSMHVVFLSSYYIKYGKWEYFATFSQLASSVETGSVALLWWLSQKHAHLNLGHAPQTPSG